jgi:hypothetical protein
VIRGLSRASHTGPHAWRLQYASWVCRICAFRCAKSCRSHHPILESILTTPATVVIGPISASAFRFGIRLQLTQRNVELVFIVADWKLCVDLDESVIND